MAAQNFPAFFAEYLAHEGGFTDDKRDPGNWTGGKVGVGRLLGTNMGIAANTYPSEDIPNLTKDRVAHLVRRDFWDRVWGDRMASGPDVVTADAAVNSGPSRGVRWTQVGAGMARSDVDGVMGPKTLAAVNTHPDKAQVVKGACRARMGFLQGLRHWETFGKGWSRRVARVEAFGLRLVGVGPLELEAEALDAQRRAVQSDRAAQGSGAVGAAGGVGTTQIDVPAVDMPLVLAAVLVLALAGILYNRWRAAHERDRAEALKLAASEGVPANG